MVESDQRHVDPSAGVTRRALLRRAVGLGATLALVPGLLAACGGGSDEPTPAPGSGDSSTGEADATPTAAPASPEAAEGEPRRGGTLTIGLREQPSTHNPYGGMSNRQTIGQFLESLVDLDKQTLEIVPALATKWEVDDELVYTFSLREGVKFHDGTDFNSEAVKAIFDYMLDPEIASPRASDFDRIESVEVDGDYQVVVKLSEPFGVFLSTLARQGYFVSPTWLQSASAAELETAPVGTGPFKMVEWVKDDRIVLERFDEYWDEELPYLDRLVYRIIPDTSVQMISLRAGEIDLVDQVPAQEVAAVEADDTLVLAVAPSAGYRSLYLNTAAPPFDDVRLRQALCWLVDRDELIRLATLGIGTPAYGPIAPPQWAYDPDFKPYQPDLAKAQALLAEAGVPDGFAFTLKVANTPEEVRMAEVLQAQFAKANIEVSIMSGEYNALRSTVIDGDYEAFLAGWLGGPDPDRNMYNTLHSNGWFNWVNYQNDEVDAALSEARAIRDQAKRIELYRKAQQIVAEDAPMVFLKFPYWAADGQAHTTRVKNFVPDPLQEMYMKDVWLEEK